MDKQLSGKVNFSKLRELMRSQDLTPLEKCTLIDLLLYAGISGNAYPSQNTIASDLTCSPRQIRNCLTKLKDKKWLIGWKRRGFSKSNQYFFNEELYYRNDTKYRKSTSSHLGAALPVQSGTVVPPNVSHESNQLSSSEVLLQFEQTSKNKCTHSDRRRLHELCEKYSETWVLDGIKEASTRGYPYLKIGLISNILQDWSRDGKPQPKPVFHPCGKDGCDRGYIFNSDRQTFTICDCREKHDQQMNREERKT